MRDRASSNRAPPESGWVGRRWRRVAVWLLTYGVDADANPLLEQRRPLACCLVGRPSVVLLDEPSEGIQLSIVEQIARHLHDLSVRRKLAILVVEQDLQFVAGIAQRAYVMRKGRFVSELAPGDLADPAIVKEQLGI